MPVDEEFLEEMQKYIEEYHKMNGAPDKIARLLANFNVYFCRLVHVESRISVVYKFKSELNDIIGRFQENYEISNYEIMKFLYDELKNLINEEEIRRKQEKIVHSYLYIEDGIIKCRHTYD